MRIFFGEGKESNTDVGEDGGDYRDSNSDFFSGPFKSFITKVQLLEQQMEGQIRDIIALQELWKRLEMGEGGNTIDFVCFFPRLWKEWKEWNGKKEKKNDGAAEVYFDGIEMWIKEMRDWMRERERWVDEIEERGYKGGKRGMGY